MAVLTVAFSASSKAAQAAPECMRSSPSRRRSKKSFSGPRVEWFSASPAQAAPESGYSAVGDAVALSRINDAGAAAAAAVATATAGRRAEPLAESGPRTRVAAGRAALLLTVCRARAKPAAKKRAANRTQANMLSPTRRRSRPVIPIAAALRRRPGPPVRVRIKTLHSPLYISNLAEVPTTPSSFCLGLWTAVSVVSTSPQVWAPCMLPSWYFLAPFWTHSGWLLKLSTPVRWVHGCVWGVRPTEFMVHVGDIHIYPLKHVSTHQ
jgi:hypothetical protein